MLVSGLMINNMEDGKEYWQDGDRYIKFDRLMDHFYWKLELWQTGKAKKIPNPEPSHISIKFLYTLNIILKCRVIKLYKLSYVYSINI